VINIFGLSLGITSCVIIFLLVSYEASFDRFNKNYERIYRVVHSVKTSNGVDYNSSTPYTFAKAFRNDFADIPLATQIDYENEMLVRIGNEKHIVWNVIFADTLFFKVFDFKVLSGNPDVALGEPGKIFITKSLAAKILKNKGNTIIVGDSLEAEIAGIVEDPLPTSHLQFSMIISMPSFSSAVIRGLSVDEWTMSKTGMSYIVLPANHKQAVVENRLVSFVKKYYKAEDASNITYKLQPLKGLHFSEEYLFNPGSENVQWKKLMLISVLGLFIIVIACINFIHLATALAINKSKEIGIRKTLGARQSQIAKYFLGETFMLTIFSVLISLCFVEWVLQWLNGFLEKQLSLDVFGNPALVVFIFILILAVTLLAGFYPAVVLSRFNPIAVLKNKSTAYNGPGAMVRRGLVVFQFLIAQVLIISTLIIAKQMDYFKNKPLGFNTDAIINIPVPANQQSKMEAFRNALLQNPNILDISFCGGSPTSYNNFNTHYYLTEKGKEEGYNGLNIKPVDIHYLSTYGIKLKAGRGFTEADVQASGKVGSDRSKVSAYIINESAMTQLGFSTPEQILGKHITTGVMDMEGEVVGVVEDFHISSLHDPVTPVVLMNFPFLYYEAGIKLQPHNLRESIEFIRTNWLTAFPEDRFTYTFLDDHLASLYRNEERTFTLSIIFAGVSIFIGCLGLYGLVSFMANQKVKEVGIRKVLGASVGSIVVLFSKEFIQLILIAFLLAVPLVWYVMNRWLEEFSYKVSLHWSVFLAGIVSTLAVALLTVSYRAIKAALTNPVHTLRSE
jgi:ABC-type antimicrobial peptide transport system permease subunit